MKQEIRISFNEKDQRLDRFLRKLFKNVELNLIFKDIRNGNIRVNGKKQKINYRIQEDDVLSIFGYYYDLNNNKSIDAEEYIGYNKPKICYEDSNILVAIKDVDTLVHSDGKNEKDLTRDVNIYLSNKGNTNLDDNLTFNISPVNRLDRNTYGLVIFGKNRVATRELCELIKFRKISKYYKVLVEGKIKDGIYTAYIKKDSKLNKSIVYGYKVPDSKEIKMELKMIDTNGVISLLDIKLITGRSHQIRSHLKFLNNPVIGDLKYGNKELKNYFFNKYGVQNQLLFAYKLHFNGINENMMLNYLNNKLILCSLTSQFKRIVRQEFKIIF